MRAPASRTSVEVVDMWRGYPAAPFGRHPLRGSFDGPNLCSSVEGLSRVLSSVYGSTTRIGHRRKEKLMRKKLFGLGLAATMMVGLLGIGVAANAAGTAKVNVVHGIPGVTVDVCVDGSKAI